MVEVSQLIQFEAYAASEYAVIGQSLDIAFGIAVLGEDFLGVLAE
ncbi:MULTISPECIES: hypothetical protein [unclassified Haladaptatus]|nr:MULTISPECIES: hypothetical protein [unclassified Haladaptatus]